MRRVVFTVAAVAGIIGLVAVFRSRPPIPAPSSAPPLRLVWAFEAPRPGSAVAAPFVTESAVFLAAVHARGFSLTGAVYALDPATGKRLWTFDHNGEMLPSASPPVLSGGRLFLGEGMHANFSCHLFCLDPITGTPQWTFHTTDHIEGGAAVDGGAVIFPAGNDGLYSLDAATGARRWNFRADLHTDSTPAIAGGRVYAGSGPSRKFKATQVVCLDATTGQPRWRTPVELPAWGSPIVAGGRVYVGLGNGRLTAAAEPPEMPAGALVCLDADTGETRWTFPVGDAVFGRPVVLPDRVLFGSRDGHLHGVSLDGRELFRVPMGGPVIASPVNAEGQVIALSVPGRVVCVDPADGREVWRQELARPGAEPHVYAALQVVGGRLYIAAEMRPSGASVGVVSLYCFELPARRGDR